MIDTAMLAFVDANDKAQLEDWARQHAEWHQRIYTEAVKQGYRKYDVFPLLRDMEDLEGWAYFHSMEHQNIANTIGVGFVDLSGLDPSDKEVMDSWLDSHAQTHTDIRTALRII